MNLKKFISVLFVMLLGASSFVFAANNNRNVYSVYSDNFIGANIYGATVSVPSTDTDGIKFYPWKATWITPNKIIMSATTVDGTDSDPAPEGKQYMRYLWGSVEDDFTTTYVGCSYTRVTNIDTETSIDMSAYAGGKIKFSARSDKEYAKKCKVGFKSNGSENWFSTPLSSLNGTWQEFSYDIPSTVGNVSVLFMAMIDNEPAHTIGESFLDIDNIRWIKNSGTARFSVVTKNVSNNQETTDPISFSVDTFGQGWCAADQYLELDIDGEFSSNNWKVQLYSSNDRAGLYNVNDAENILPMAWKVSWTTLPFNYTDSDGPNANTLKIGENKQGENIDLYDAGKVETTGNEGLKWWYPWFYLKANSDTTADSLVINNVGCHTFRNTRSGQSVPDQYFDTPISSYATDTYERKPKVFLACDTKKAKALEYTGSLVFNLSYE